MSAKSANARRPDDQDADLDNFVAEHHIEIAAKLADARAELAAGNGEPLEPLEDLLAAARSRSTP